MAKKGRRPGAGRPAKPKELPERPRLFLPDDILGCVVQYLDPEEMFRMDLTCRAYSHGVLWNHVSCFDFDARVAIWYRHQLNPTGIREVKVSYRTRLTEDQKTFLSSISQQLTSITTLSSNDPAILWLLRSVNPTKLRKLNFGVENHRNYQEFVNLFKTWQELPSLAHLELRLPGRVEFVVSTLETLCDIITPSLKWLNIHMGIWSRKPANEPFLYVTLAKFLRRNAKTLLEACVNCTPTQILQQSLVVDLKAPVDVVENKIREVTGLGLDTIRFSHLSRDVAPGMELSLCGYLAVVMKDYVGLDILRQRCWPSDKYLPSSQLRDIPAIYAWWNPYQNLDRWIKPWLERRLMELIDDGASDYYVLRYMSALMRVVDHQDNPNDAVTGLIRTRYGENEAASETTFNLWKEMIRKVLALDRNLLETLFQSDCALVLLSMPVDFYRTNPLGLDFSILVRSPSRLRRLLTNAAPDLVYAVLQNVPREHWLYLTSTGSSGNCGVLSLITADESRIDERMHIIEYIIKLLEESEPRDLPMLVSGTPMPPVVARAWFCSAFGKLATKSLPVWIDYIDALKMPRNRDEVINNISNLLDTVLSQKTRPVELPSVEFAEPVWDALVRFCSTEVMLKDLAQKVLKRCSKVPKSVRDIISSDGSGRPISRLPRKALCECLIGVIAKFKKDKSLKKKK